MGVAALVLAGTRPGGDPFAEAMGVAHKALIEIEGVTLLERVVSALRDTQVDRILVSCNEAGIIDKCQSLGVETLPAQAGPSASVAAAFDRVGAPMIVTTSDHALLDPAWVEQLLRDTPQDADLSVMLARRERIESAMPGSRRTYLRFADGEWSGCNLFYLRTAAARRAIDMWGMVEKDRKRPWRIAARLGPATILSMLLRRLTLSEGLAKLGRRIGVAASLVAAEDGLAAVDVDKDEDLEAVRQLLLARR